MGLNFSKVKWFKNKLKAFFTERSLTFNLNKNIEMNTESRVLGNFNSYSENSIISLLSRPLLSNPYLEELLQSQPSRNSDSVRNSYSFDSLPIFVHRMKGQWLQQADVYQTLFWKMNWLKMRNLLAVMVFWIEMKSVFQIFKVIFFQKRQKY